MNNRFVALTFLLLALYPVAGFCEDGSSGGSLVPIGAAITMGLAAFGGTSGQGKAIGSALDSIGRNPSASDKIFTPMVIGLVFVESLVILSFVIAYLLIS